MNYAELINTLKAKFQGNVRTRDVVSFYQENDLPGKYFNQMRNEFGVDRGVLNFDGHQATAAVENVLIAPKIEETDDEVYTRIKTRFDIIDVMADATVTGINRALIISGPAGVGKSFSVERIVESTSLKYMQIKGRITPISLYKALFKHREKGQVILIDDCDSVFGDENSLNILKAACDSSKTRKICWMTSKPIEDEEGDIIPSTFEYNGSVIFLTNIDFEDQIDRDTRMSPHFAALMSRAHFVDLSMKSKRDYIIRIKQILIDGGMLEDELTLAQRWELFDYINENRDSMRELSLRMVCKLSDLMLMSDNWRELAKVTCQKTV